MSHSGFHLQTVEPTRAIESRWETVRKGLSIVSFATGAMAPFIVVSVAVVLLAWPTGGGQGNPPGPLVAVLWTALLFESGLLIAIIVGQFMCCAVPDHTGAKGLAIAAAVLAPVTVLLSCGFGFSGLLPVGLGSLLVRIAAGVLFALFLRRLGRYFQDPGLEASAGGLVVFGVVYSVVAWVLRLGVAGPAGLLVVVGSGLGIVIELIWTALLTRGVRDRIAERTAGGVAWN